MGDTAGLSDEQHRALDRLSRLPALAAFYLAGGSAIAIRLVHRRSLDLDFFSREPTADLDAVKRSVETAFARVEVRAQTDVALHLLCDGLPIDFVRYPYPPFEPPEESPLGVGVATLTDLGVMKLSAIARRGLRRDFWDLFEILNAGPALRQIGEAYTRRFGVRESDLYHVLRALTYFDDAEKDPVFPRGLSKEKWESVKAFFGREAPRLVVEA